jgi:hypothetical protein
MADKAKVKAPGRGKWWVVQQHQQVDVVESAERPSTDVEVGERAKRVKGPYREKADAQAVRDRLKGATLKVRSGKESV